MRANRILLLAGLVFFFFFGGLVFFLMPARTETGVASMEVVPPEAAVVTEQVSGMQPMPYIILGVIILLAIVMVAVQLRGRALYMKRKNEDLAPPDPYLEDMVDQGMLHLEADGELPDWQDDLMGEKRKRE